MTFCSRSSPRATEEAQITQEMMKSRRRRQSRGRETNPAWSKTKLQQRPREETHARRLPRRVLLGSHWGPRRDEGDQRRGWEFSLPRKTLITPHHPPQPQSAPSAPSSHPSPEIRWLQVTDVDNLISGPWGGGRQHHVHVGGVKRALRPP